MIRVFENLQEYNTFTNNGQNLVSGDLYWVKQEKSAFFLTNNIDGEVKKYDMMDEIPEGYIQPTGNIAINANGEEIDISQYATASVNVPIPEGYIKPSGNKEITANGTNIDVNDYATATVNVPVPPEYIIPTGNVSLTENGENIDIAQYATATVNVPSRTEDLVDLIERDITSITIPSGTTYIGQSAFQGCTSLTSITIPNTVTSIGSNAFQSCSSLTSIDIPDSVTNIGQGAFLSCTSLPVENYIKYADTIAVEVTNKTQTTYTLKTGTRYINYMCFNGCSNITSIGPVGSGADIEIPNSVFYIGVGAFQSCSGLTSVTIPNNITDIGISAFNVSNNIATVTIDMTTVPNVLQSMNSITTLIFGSNVTTIGGSAFTRCNGLTSVTIPNNVTEIGAGAFQGCTGLTSVTIGSGVISIGVSAFQGCTGLTSVTINATTPPSLGGINTFNGSYPIYVPAESVDAYKGATNWSAYADRIQAIPTE